jgi:basic membrane protein A
MKSSTKLLAVVAIIIIVGVGGGYAAWYFLVAPKPNPYQVAIVFATGGLGDKSFNDGCYEGALNARDTHGVQFTYAEPTEIAQYEGFQRFFASHQGFIEPFELIIGIGFDQAAAIETVAGEYPDQKFAIVDMYINHTTYPNVASLLFSAAEGSALVGYIAGNMTTTGQLGFVGGLSIPLIWEFAAGYFWGANESNPSLGLVGGSVVPDNASVAYTNDWTDTNTGKLAADAMYAAGTDIVFAAAGRAGLGVIESAKVNNATYGPIWFIGVDSPQMYLGCTDPNNPAPPTVGLTSMLKRVDVAIFEVIKDALGIGGETFVPGFNIYNLANGGVGYEINQALLNLSASLLADVDAFADDIANGIITPPIDIAWVH